MDIATAMSLHFEPKATKADLVKVINSHIDATLSLQENPRFCGLFASCLRGQKRSINENDASADANLPHSSCRHLAPTSTQWSSQLHPPATSPSTHNAVVGPLWLPGTLPLRDHVNHMAPIPGPINGHQYSYNSYPQNPAMHYISTIHPVNTHL